MVGCGQCRRRQTGIRAVSAEARTRLPAARALVAAEIAYAENDGARAIRELDQSRCRPRQTSRRTIGGSAAAAHF